MTHAVPTLSNALPILPFLLRKQILLKKKYWDFVKKIWEKFGKGGPQAGRRDYI